MPCFNVSFIDPLVNNVYLVRQFLKVHLPSFMQYFPYSECLRDRTMSQSCLQLKFLSLLQNYNQQIVLSTKWAIHHAFISHMLNMNTLKFQKKINVNFLSKISEYSSCHFYFVEIDYVHYASQYNIVIQEIIKFIFNQEVKHKCFFFLCYCPSISQTNELFIFVILSLNEFLILTVHANTVHSEYVMQGYDNFLLHTQIVLSDSTINISLSNLNL